ncbi:MAG: glycoside hydrolase family 92 protein [Clostridia bacterium]|nr:glycoside hydrolase family 92 protein [Clostridia bacterium]
MIALDLCKYVDVFHGCGEITPAPEGIAKKWFFIKAGSGNTSPAACLPFGAMSVCPFSGGYPTGYGNHLVNCHSRPAKFEGGEKLLGFAHLQQSGTGAIGYYYNYALVTPYYVHSGIRRTPEDEFAEPGYYSCLLDDIKCEITAGKRTAYHRYTFPDENGKVKIDFASYGLDLPGEGRKHADGVTFNMSGNTVAASFTAEGINLFFAVRHNGKAVISDGSVYVTDFGKQAEIAVSISLVSCEKALAFLSTALTFDEAQTNAYNVWNSYLSKIKIETADENIKKIFYSNLYHSFIKPCDFSGESFFYEKGKPFFTDFATLWDMYKTALPLIFMLFKDEGEGIIETLLLSGEALGEIPNSICLTDDFITHSSQARLLGAYVLLTAYTYGYDIDVKRMLAVIESDVFAENKKDFTVSGKCGSHTWMLDMADACANAARVAGENGETAVASKLKPLSEQWKTVYDENTGLLKSDSDYYEGTLYNYSFRQMADMDARIDLAGGKENFVKLLDDFFGYGREDVTLPTDPSDYAPVEKGMALCRFEGFNNESDTEAPFSYIYAGRHDRTCEIIRAGMKCMFTQGRGGIPGNNDSGALSSLYCLSALGIYPEAGQDLFLIGSPFVDSAQISLFNGGTLNITVQNNSEENICVESVKFNGEEINDYKIKASDLMKGGTLLFKMTDKVC